MYLERAAHDRANELHNAETPRLHTPRVSNRNQHCAATMFLMRPHVYYSMILGVYKSPFPTTSNVRHTILADS